MEDDGDVDEVDEGSSSSSDGSSSDDGEDMHSPEKKLEIALKDNITALNLFMNNKFEESQMLLKDKADGSMVGF